MIGPIVIFAAIFVALQVAPITLLLLIMLWDSQHSIMQQHGFGRIYDFKAGSGSPRTPRFDLCLHWILFGNMFLNAPLFVTMWLRALYRLNLTIPVNAIRTLQLVCWTVTAVYLVIYLVHVIRSVQRGYPINPMKYLFIAASYFLWYYVAWNTNSILLYAVAHRIMHGVQYIVMVYAFMDRTARQPDKKPGFWKRIAGPGHLRWFLVGGAAYAVLFQLLINHPLDEFGFGVVNFAPYPAIPQFNLPALGFDASYALFSQMMVYSYGMMHYYLDSFIWKVRDKQVQAGL